MSGNVIDDIVDSFGILSMAYILHIKYIRAHYHQTLSWVNLYFQLTYDLVVLERIPLVDE